MDELHVGAEKLVFEQDFDAAKFFDLAQRASGVLRDRQSEAAREFPFLLVGFRRRVAGAARGEAPW